MKNVVKDQNDHMTTQKSHTYNMLKKMNELQTS